MTVPPLLEVRDLRHQYPSGEGLLHVLRGVSLSIERGSFTAIMGTSGTGKSTLLYIFGMLLRPTRGSIFFNGTSVSGWDDRRISAFRADRIGFIFQDYNLIPGLTLFENVETGLAYTSLPRPGWPERCRRAIAEVDQLNKIDQPASLLSGGEAQRAAIARVTVKEPELVLADEPTGSLDGEAEEVVLGLLRGLVDKGTAVVLVTHDPRVAQCADLVLRLEEGLLVSSVD